MLIPFRKIVILLLTFSFDGIYNSRIMFWTDVVVVYPFFRNL